MGWVPIPVSDAALTDLSDASVAGAVEGDMIYRNAAGLWVVVGGTKGDGKAPMGQADGSVQWETPSGGGGGGGTFNDVSAHAGSPAASDEFNDDSWGGTTVESSPTTTVTERYGQLSIAHPGGGAAARIHGYMIPFAPAGDFHVLATVSAYGKDIFQNFDMIGVIASDGVTHGSGNQIWAGIELPNSRQDLRRHTNWTTQAASSTGTNGEMAQRFKLRGMVVCLEYEASSNVWKAYYSHDGNVWMYKGRTLTHSITVSHVGIMLTTWGGSRSIVGNAQMVRAYNGLLGDTILT